MAYRALYRIYRPTTFDEVAGQEHITDVLRNQVKLGRLSHAYLFCGPRGTGKTTMAKILSRAANCLSPINGEACGTCEMCRISAGTNADIMEIDAASNNGVDNVRDLIDQAQFAPLQLKRRVFIIDEVHMLSQSAFNALLKTLEEPPEHVLFILATTEPEKLLATVISRCQRFDFKRLTMQNIVNYMEKVLIKEEVAAETDALRTIAHAADGGMRDALSLLNQCISIAGKTLTVNNVRDVIGSVEEDFLFSLAEKIIIGDGSACMREIEKVVREGKDLGVLAKDLSSHMRALLLTSVCGQCADLLETTEDTADRYEKQAKSVSKERLLYYCEELIKARTSIRYFPNPRLLMETTILRICYPEGEHSNEALLSRVSALEERSREPAHCNETCLASSYSINNKTLSKYENESEQNDNGLQCVNGSADILPEEASAEDHNTILYSADDLPVTAVANNSDHNQINVNSRSPFTDREPKQQKSKADNNEAENVFFRFRKALNPLTAKYLDLIIDKMVIDNKLILFYDSKNKEKVSMLTASALSSQLQAAAESSQCGLKVILQEKKGEELPKEDEHLKALFGDIVSIEK